MSKENDSLFKKWHAAVFVPVGAALYLVSPFASEELKSRTIAPAKAGICEITDGRIFADSCDTGENAPSLNDPF